MMRISVDLPAAVQAQHADLGAGEERQRDVANDVIASAERPSRHAIHCVDVLRHLSDAVVMERALSGMLRR